MSATVKPLVRSNIPRRPRGAELTTAPIPEVRVLIQSVPKLRQIDGPREKAAHRRARRISMALFAASTLALIALVTVALHFWPVVRS